MCLGTHLLVDRGLVNLPRGATVGLFGDGVPVWCLGHLLELVPLCELGTDVEANTERGIQTCC